ncbi:MAG: PLP-dependent transferase, partial [Candidatus Eremiobacterota bacterium]
SSIAKKAKARLIVDISVQPLQDLLQEGADLIVLSLSKYPSTGLTLGGAILCNNPVYIKKCHTNSTSEGHILSPESASTIWSQIISLRDRMFALSIKTEKIASFLKAHPTVTKVRIPDKYLCGGLTGGQITFHLHNPLQCAMMEKIIGHNSLLPETSLSLACTFGAPFTTFEHFASNIRHRELIPREETGEIDIPDDIIRLGIGYESHQNIIKDLEFLLNTTDRICQNKQKDNKFHPLSFTGLTLNDIYSQEKSHL